MTRWPDIETSREVCPKIRGVFTVVLLIYISNCSIFGTMPLDAFSVSRVAGVARRRKYT